MKSPGYPGAFSLHAEPCVAAVEQGASANLTRYDEQEDDPGPDPERAGAGSASARKHLIDAITDEQQRAQRCAEEQERQMPSGSGIDERRIAGGNKSPLRRDRGKDQAIKDPDGFITNDAFFYGIAGDPILET